MGRENSKNEVPTYLLKEREGVGCAASVTAGLICSFPPSFCCLPLHVLCCAVLCCAVLCCAVV